MGNEHSANIEPVLPEDLDKIDENVYLLQSGFNFLNIKEIGLNGLVICTKEKGSGENMLVLINPPKFKNNLGALQTIEKETGARVKLIIQPGDWHHMQLPDAQKYYPDAKMYVASERNIRKQKKITATVVDRVNPEIPELGEDFELVPWLGFTQDSMPWLMSGESKGAHRIEFVVFHKPSSTMFFTDHFFPPSKEKLFDPNTGGFKLVDEDLAKQSVQRIVDLNPARLVFSHGKREFCVLATESGMLKSAYDGLLDAHRGTSKDKAKTETES